MELRFMMIHQPPGPELPRSYALTRIPPRIEEARACGLAGRGLV
jgi:hypothetical protein